jgi:UDP-N-acetylmuramate--alanine ligase
MKRIHFVGVSGIGVSALALISLESGYSVSGSADIENEQTELLKSKGLRFFLGHRASQVNRPDVVVRSAAVPAENPEIREAQRKSIPVYLYSEYLGTLMGEKKGIAVAGTHGKTTTTAIVAMIFTGAGFDPTVVCGGVMNNFSSNAVYGKGDYFISEACEYNRSFLDLRKRHCIVTNIETDHLDYYRDINDIKQAFHDFLLRTDPGGFAIVNGDDEHTRDVLRGISENEVYRVGFGMENHYRIAGIQNRNGFYSFQLIYGKDDILNLRLSVPGRFNCLNAALSAALALKVGISHEIIEGSVRSYSGTKRRLEYLGTVGGNPVYTDYAHHPTEIRSTLETLREIHQGLRICAVFQPHQYSRTVKLFHGFVEELLKADIILLREIFRQRDSDVAVGSISSRDLLAELKKTTKKKKIVFIEDNIRLFSLLNDYDNKNTVIAFIGAGDIDDIARKYVDQK